MQRTLIIQVYKKLVPTGKIGHQSHIEQKWKVKRGSSGGTSSKDYWVINHLNKVGIGIRITPP